MLVGGEALLISLAVIQISDLEALVEIGFTSAMFMH